MIVGTAGHIDHGKTSLLRALTGVEGDRRREERERGMTIDLGYVYAPLIADGPLTGFIDVPGHERFVHNMLAGASGIDLVLLVIAADDGVMPQTREHLAIVELLGIERAIVAVTKCDRVESVRLDEVRREIAGLLDSGAFAGAPIFPVSSVSNEGIDALRGALIDAEKTFAHEQPANGFRLAVDRAFSVAGAGVVVTGTAFSGRVAVGDQLVLGNTGRPVRVRGLHAQNREAQHASAGQRVALNLSGERLNVEQIHRGDWLQADWLHAPTNRVDIDLHLLASEKTPFKHWTPVHVHLGAQDVTARVALLEGEVLQPGERAFAQLVLNAPVHAVHGDRVVLRDQSAQRTLGGGAVLDPFAPARHRRAEPRRLQLQALAEGGFEASLPALLAHSDGGVEPRRLERQFNRPAVDWALPDSVVEITARQGKRLFARSRWAAWHAHLLARLRVFHDEQPDELGPDRDRLRRFAAPTLERPVFTALLETLIASGDVQASGPWLHLPDHQVRLTGEEERLKTEVMPLLLVGHFDPPWVRNVAQTLGADEALTRHLLRKLARLGQLHQVVRDLFYPEATVEELASVVLRLEREEGIIRAAAFRTALGIGRKRSIQILEYFDRIGLTRRFGNERKVRQDSALAGGIRSL
ncbi:selenocysteine-specific translation elongation factor [Pseudomonas matsuisoli]|uniref:Selenocysteine-specific elongation factor n=1 Tax=Pseudomonas matsuisoli TaxID=1515666 RepID=A0A917PTT2_9PSED|nr:selenocysteine-specific translation elongation factor [Pseudomonas matsuisoli]GGJ92259.1 selenocysteine-specific translation factor [Pseudomonas matsuisoli]